MKKITIDLRMLNCSGIGTYLKNTVPKIIKLMPHLNFSLLVRTEDLKKNNWFKDHNVTTIPYDAAIYSISEQIKTIRKIPKDSSLFWSPHYNFPFLYKGKLLVTIHDLFHVALPHLVGGFHKRLYAKYMFKAVLNKANTIITNSDFTKSEFLRLIGSPKYPIITTYLGVDEEWRNVKKNPSPYSWPFLLFVGNVKPHKNLKTLIKAFEIIKDRIPHHLIIVGKKDGFITKDKKILHYTRGIDTRISFTGHINDALLKQYFSHADLFVFPSYYEGFGLPPLEAMAIGCPSIVSQIPSLIEVCGEAVHYFNSNDAQNLAEKMLNLINNNSLKLQLCAKGIKRSESFTWERCALLTSQIITNLLNNKA